MSQTKISGEVANATLKESNSKSGWQNYDIAFKDGNTYRIGWPPNATYVPTAGDVIGAFETVRGDRRSWILDCSGYLTPDRDALLPTPAAGSSANGSSAPQAAAPRSMSRDDYWRGKDKYEKEVRDPKIEFQTYFRIVADIYAAAIPQLEITSENLNSVIDDIYAKAQAILNLRNEAEK